MRLLPFTLMPALLGVALSATGSGPSRPSWATGLTLEDRIRAQSRIERVFYEHRIWPKENPGPKPPFETMVPEPVIAKNAVEGPLLSDDLAQFRGGMISEAMLQAETRRMAAQSRDPALLHELYSALDDDPRLIAEIIARPSLARRLLSAPPPEMPDAGGCDVWLPTAATTVAARGGHTAVWTGAEMIVWGGNDGVTGNLNSGGRYTPATDSWAPTDTVTAPASRSYHLAVWTGSEMIIWGGRLDMTGGRYNPVSDSWTATNTTGAPGNAYAGPPAWTGTELIVWGGNDSGGNYLNTGARYKPSTDSWTAMTVAGAPVGRAGHSAVWTGTEFIVWGGSIQNSPFWTSTGSRYLPGTTPGTDSWTATPAYLGVRTAHSAVWTGTEMIVWGGTTTSTTFFNTGARYTPGGGWTPTSATGVPAIRAGHKAVWSGADMILWGGKYYNGSATTYYNSGGRYKPSGDSWLATSTGANVPAGRTNATAVWTGNALIVWGGNINNAATPTNTGAVYLYGPEGAGNTVRGGKSATVDLTWTAPAGASSYNVRRCTVTAGPCTPTAIAGSPSSPSYSEANDANSYMYSVESVNACGTAP